MRGEVSPNGPLEGAPVLSSPLRTIWYCLYPARQLAGLMQVISVSRAREAIPQPTPRPDTSKEIRRSSQPCPVPEGEEEALQAKGVHLPSRCGSVLSVFDQNYRGGGRVPGSRQPSGLLHVAKEKNGPRTTETGATGLWAPFSFFLHSFLTDTDLVDGLGTRDSDSGTVF